MAYEIIKLILPVTMKELVFLLEPALVSKCFEAIT